MAKNTTFTILGIVLFAIGIIYFGIMYLPLISLGLLSKSLQLVFKIPIIIGAILNISTGFVVFMRDKSIKTVAIATLVVNVLSIVFFGLVISQTIDVFLFFMAVYSVVGIIFLLANSIMLGVILYLLKQKEYLQCIKK